MTDYAPSSGVASPAVVDLRSDTVTKPTPAMREAIARAVVGDDVFGDDPTVNALQERVAALLGKEAALFMSSGTQSNLCGLLAHCGRGDEYIVGQLAHTYRYEGGGAAVLGSIGSIPGAMLGGVLLGLAETFASGYMPAEYKDVVAFGLLVLVLLFPPTGLLGKPDVEKV